MRRGQPKRQVARRREREKREEDRRVRAAKRLHNGGVIKWPRTHLRSHGTSGRKNNADRVPTRRKGRPACRAAAEGDAALLSEGPALKKEKRKKKKKAETAMFSARLPVAAGLGSNTSPADALSGSVPLTIILRLTKH